VVFGSESMFDVAGRLVLRAMSPSLMQQILTLDC
jgi:hypothetical protein